MMKKILLIALYLAIGIAFFVLTYIQNSVKISEGFHAFIYLYQGFFYAFLLVANIINLIRALRPKKRITSKKKDKYLL